MEYNTSIYQVHCPVIQVARIGMPLGVAAYSGWLTNTAYETVLSNYQQITPEVEGGWWWVYGDNPHGWGGMDRLAEYARAYGMEVFYHCLRWCWGAQPPDPEAWIVEAMTRYPSIYAWVVVNEGYNCWNGTETIPMIEDSYRIARMVKPAAQLWYNGLLFNPVEWEPVKALISAGLVDSVGIQMHHDLDETLDQYAPFVEWLVANRVPWAVTELDVIIPNVLPETLQRQAGRYREVAQFCLDYGAEFLAMWGVSDANSWQYEYYPLPFGRDYSPKPAWAAVQNVLR